jgi:deoxycytidylate deaminase
MQKTSRQPSKKARLDKLTKFPPFLDSEVVVGLVGRIGVETEQVVNLVTDVAGTLNYRVVRKKLTKGIPDIAFLPRVKMQPVESKYDTFIHACNVLREKTKLNEIMSLLGILEIQKDRRDRHGDPRVPAKRTIYILDQLKRKEEIALLRTIYGPLFIQISCHSPLEKRKANLLQRILESHKSSKSYEKWSAEADKLILRDDSEDSVPTGQRVADAFPMADLIVDTSNPQEAKDIIGRFFRSFFGDFTVSPTVNEYGMNLAHNAALRSLDLSRQVGASILSKRGEVACLGCNEVPKAGGGTYWTGDKNDTRDFTKGYDYNTNRKRGMLIDVVVRLRDSKFLSKSLAGLDDQQLEEKLFAKDMKGIHDAQILDTLEFGRAMHAEMCALTDAARNGRAVRDHILYATVFPCHNCAKHIVGAGIAEVQYLKPYAKSEASLLYPDSIATDEDGKRENHVSFRQFTGITPRRYPQVFEKERLKDSDGRLLRWEHKTACPIAGVSASTYIDLEASFLANALEKLPKRYNFLQRTMSRKR